MRRLSRRCTDWTEIYPHPPRADAPGASVRGLSFWRWCSLRSETACFRAIGRLWRLVVRARPLARIAPSQARGATPAALPRSHRRRLLPPLPPAPPLRPRPPHRTQPLDPRGRAPPVCHDGQARRTRSGQAATGVPGLRRGAGRSEGFAVLRTSMNGQIAKRRAKLIATGGVGLAVVGPGRGHDELQRPRSPRWRRNGSGVISTAAGGHIRSRGRGRSAWPVRTSGPVPFPGAFCSLWRYLRPCALRDGLVVGHP